MPAKKYISMSNVESSDIHRLSTGSLELDWMYGTSIFNNGIPSYQAGMPVGKISNWIGEGGVGKSRMAIAVSRAIVRRGNTVLYFQNEVDINTFANWVKIDDSNLDKFYCSSVTSLSEQLEIIKEVKPDVIFVDSINLLDEFRNGTSSDIKLVVDGFREVINETGSHVVFLCQLNKDGSAKGSSSLTHLSDINFVLTRDPEGFRISVGVKHRYGKTGPNVYGIWKHISAGVKRVSNNRWSDREWVINFPDDIPIFVTPNQVKKEYTLETFNKEESPWDTFNRRYQELYGKKFELTKV